MKALSSEVAFLFFSLVSRSFFCLLTMSRALALFSFSSTERNSLTVREEI